MPGAVGNIKPSFNPSQQTSEIGTVCDFGDDEDARFTSEEAGVRRDYVTQLVRRGSGAQARQCSHTRAPNTLCTT